MTFQTTKRIIRILPNLLSVVLITRCIKGKGWFFSVVANNYNAKAAGKIIDKPFTSSETCL